MYELDYQVGEGSVLVRADSSTFSLPMEETKFASAFNLNDSIAPISTSFTKNSTKHNGGENNSILGCPLQARTGSLRRENSDSNTSRFLCEETNYSSNKRQSLGGKSYASATDDMHSSFDTSDIFSIKLKRKTSVLTEVEDGKRQRLDAALAKAKRQEGNSYNMR